MSISICFILGLGMLQSQLSEKSAYPSTVKQPPSIRELNKSRAEALESFIQTDLLFASRIDNHKQDACRCEEKAHMFLVIGDEKNANEWAKLAKLFMEMQTRELKQSLKAISQDIQICDQVTALYRTVGDEKKAQHSEELLKRLERMHTKLKEQALTDEKQP